MVWKPAARYDDNIAAKPKPVLACDKHVQDSVQPLLVGSIWAALCKALHCSTALPPSSSARHHSSLGPFLRCLQCLRLKHGYKG